MIWLLAEAIKAEHSVIDLRPSMYMNALLYNDEEKLATDDYKSYIADILKDDPGILRREPVIFLANPAIKPVVAEILAEEPTILASDPNIIAQYPDLLELNPELKDMVKEFLEEPGNEEYYPRLVKLVA